MESLLPNIPPHYKKDAGSPELEFAPGTTFERAKGQVNYWSDPETVGGDSDLLDFLYFDGF